MTNKMSVKFEPNIDEKFHVARYLNANFENICSICNNTGHRKEISLYKEPNAYDSTFEYYKYMLCPSCKVITNQMVPIKVGTVYETEHYEFKINSSGFRSDEFTDIHHRKHILFVGCSNTYGMGMKLENVWAHRLYSKLKQEESLSGYYNLGHIGAKISESISNIFLYCKRYAKPDVIFFLMPTIGREMSPNQTIGKQTDEEIFMNFVYRKQQVIDMYMMLEEYCKSNNIKLITKTWDTTKGFLSVHDTLKNFKTFVHHDQNVFGELILRYCENNKDDAYAMRAADGLHAGNASMYAESEIMYNAYKEIL